MSRSSSIWSDAQEHTTYHGTREKKEQAKKKIKKAHV